MRTADEDILGILWLYCQISDVNESKGHHSNEKIKGSMCLPELRKKDIYQFMDCCNDCRLRRQSRRPWPCISFKRVSHLELVQGCKKIRDKTLAVTSDIIASNEIRRESKDLGRFMSPWHARLFLGLWEQHRSLTKCTCINHKKYLSCIYSKPKMICVFG